MENRAYKWIKEWVDSGGYWNRYEYSGFWDLSMHEARSYFNGYINFREDMIQLLEDAEAGRKLREVKS